MLKATKIRIYPNTDQADYLNRQFGAVRFVYNKGLHIISSQYQRHGLCWNAKRDIKKLLPIAKKSRKYGWLKDFDSIALQQACLNLSTAYQRFFDPKIEAQYPRFKRKHGKQSSYHCVGVSIGDDWIKIPKLAPIKARVHRDISGALKSITLSRTKTGKYFAAILVDDGIETPKQVSVIDSIIGIDLGIAQLLSSSDGQQITNPRFQKNAEANLRRKQKALSRTKKGSRGRGKARLALAKAHERLANTRSDFQHKLSKQLVVENQAVVVETLKIKNMLKNRKLSKHISDAAWGELIRKLDYKTREFGHVLVKIDQWYPSSKTCSCCGYKLESLSLSIREWECPACLVQHERDINAAVNIRQQGILKLRAEGLSVSANGGLRKSDHVSVAA